MAAMFSMMMIAMASCMDSCLCVRQKRAATARGSSPSYTDNSCRPESAVSTLKLISGSREAEGEAEAEAGAEGEAEGREAGVGAAEEDAGAAAAAEGAASTRFSLSDRSLLGVGCFAAIAAYEMRWGSLDAAAAGTGAFLPAPREEAAAALPGCLAAASARIRSPFSRARSHAAYCFVPTGGGGDAVGDGWGEGEEAGAAAEEGDGRGAWTEGDEDTGAAAAAGDAVGLLARNGTGGRVGCCGCAVDAAAGAGCEAPECAMGGRDG